MNFFMYKISRQFLFWKHVFNIILLMFNKKSLQTFPKLTWSNKLYKNNRSPHILRFCNKINLLSLLSKAIWTQIFGWDTFDISCHKRNFLFTQIRAFVSHLRFWLYWYLCDSLRVKRVKSGINWNELNLKIFWNIFTLFVVYAIECNETGSLVQNILILFWLYFLIKKNNMN